MTDRLALTIPEAAAQLGFSEQHFRRYVLKDVGVFYVGSLARVRCADLEAWLANQRASNSDGIEAAGRSDAPSAAPVLSAAQESAIEARAKELREKAARYSGPSCTEIARSRGSLHAVPSSTRGR